MRILRFWIYLPLTFGIASLISFFAWSYFILGAILGILGLVFIYTIPFELDKKDENIINILYPSDSVKSEFEKVQGEFFNHFKRKVNNYKIEVEYSNDVTLKKEIVTKRSIFDNFVEINPVLKDLDDLLKLDLS